MEPWFCQRFDRERRSTVGLLALILIHLRGCSRHCVCRTENLMCQEGEDGSTHGGCLINFIHLVRVEPGENGKIRKEQKSCGYFQLPVVAEIPRHLWGLVNFGSSAWHWCVLGPQPFPLSPPAAYCSLLLPVLHSLAAGLCIRSVLHPSPNIFTLALSASSLYWSHCFPFWGR